MNTLFIGLLCHIINVNHQDEKNIIILHHKDILGPFVKKFITICTKNCEHYFGEIQDGKMILNELGNICDEQLRIMMMKRPTV